MVLTANTVRLGAVARDKAAAIRAAGELLVRAGSVEPSYVAGMEARERTMSTYLGGGVAIPHGRHDDLPLVHRTALSVLQIPGGVEWEPGELVYLVVGIAAVGDEHIELLAQLGEIVEDAALTRALIEATDPELVVQSLVRAASAGVVIHNLTGLHARPAGEFARIAKRFQSDIRVRHGDKRANGKSLASLLTLGATCGARIQIEADGADRAAALAALTAAVAAGLGEGVDEARPPPAIAAAAPAAEELRVGRGAPAAPGRVIGPIYQLRPTQVRATGPSGSAADERARLDAALRAARAELTAVRGRVADDVAGIFDVHIELLEDPEVLEVVQRRIADGAGAAQAWQSALDEQARAVAAAGDALVAARADDLADVAERVLRLLDGASEPDALPDHPVIVFAPDLSPSQTSAFAPERVLGICTAAGGPTSHAAILARSLGIPSVVGAGSDVLTWPSGALVLLDGDAGTVLRDPSAVEARAVETAARPAQLAPDAAPAVTRDGHRVEVGANVGSVAEARRAAAVGADGVGLLRTEFLFSDRAQAPTEDEQRAAYAGVAAALGGRPIIIRTLDVGGDKPLPYVPQPPEANPFLGVRGIRLCLAQPALLRQQLRAILGAASAGPLRIMLPMVTDLDELRAARAMLADAAAELGAPPLELGIMIEIPAAALLAHALAPAVDFFSIGSNDLAQYTLAMDRTSPVIAPRADGLHPAVLQLIDLAVRAAHQHGKWIGLCGELGADLAAVPILVGLGLDELSVAAPAVPAVKARIRTLSFAHARELAARALRCATASEVRRQVIS